ncbi:hypothetical protein [Halosegnis sp.]|uniref:hypothetical protein n=1 Tax=Halosegnis sp. TaxID=2864959 RepID=UPI0035D43C76
MSRPRRSFLASVGTLLSGALGGCLATRRDARGATPVSSATPTDDPTPQPTPHSPTDGWVGLNLVQTSLSAIVERAVRAPSSFEGAAHRVIDQLATTDAVAVSDIRRYDQLPLHPPYLVAYEDGIARISQQVTATRSVDVYRLRIAVLEESRATARPFSELSTVDQAIVNQGLTEEYRTHGTPFQGTFTYRVAQRAPPDSWILTADEPVFVAYEADTLRLDPQGTETVVEQDVRYERTRVAADRAAARRYIAREYVEQISTAVLPTAHREILTAAIASAKGYREAGQGSAAFRAVLDRLHDVPQVPNDSRYIRYDGQLYRVVQTGVEV